MMLLSFNIKRPVEQANYWNTFAGNIFLLLFCGGILLAARFFPIDRLRMGFCVFLNLTGFPCPTCGFTRAICDFTGGNWAGGIHECPLALVIFILMIVVIIYNVAVIVAAFFGVQIRRGLILQLSSKKAVFLAVVFFLLLMANWIYRLSTGLK